MSTANLDLDFSPDTPAYIIYTSGSTGEPKGCSRISSSHHAARAEYPQGFRTGCQRSHAAVQQHDVSTHRSNRCWFPGAWERACSFAATNSGHLPSSGKWCEQHALTAINLPPAYFRHCTEALDVDSGVADSLRLVIVGGDVFPVDVVAQMAGPGRATYSTPTAPRKP